MKICYSAVDQWDVKATTHLIRKIAKTLTCLGVTLSCASSCGILGDKKDVNRSLAQSGACLDNLGPLTNAFLDGTVSEGNWRATWDCMDDTIELFGKFVQGSDTAGYSPEDLRFLMQKFLFTTGTVTPKFVDGTLAVKASLFGGTDKKLSNAELASFRALARFLKEETTVLIPHLRNRKTNPTPDNMRAFAIAVETFGAHFADYLNTAPNQKLTIEQAVAFTSELAKLSFETDASTVEQWTRLGQEVKSLLVHGAQDGIAGADWTKILKYGFSLGGSAIAYFDVQDDQPLFQIEMVNRIQGVLNKSVADWGNEIPFLQIERLVDHVPNSVLPTLADDFKVGIKALLHGRSVTANGVTTPFRPGLAHLLLTRSDNGIGADAIERLVAAYRTGMRANMHLTGIYSGVKEDLLPADFETRAKNYAKTRTPGEQADVTRLITIAKRYPGLHPANTPEILFNDQTKHSQNNLSRMSWYELAAGLLLEAYGTTSNTYGKAATLTDLNTLIDDLGKFLFSVGMSHPLKENVGAKRFREANLFMPNGNGDDKMDLPETSVYLAFLFSSGKQNNRIVESSLKGDHPCPTLGWDVPLKQQIYDIQCYRDRFSGNFKELYQNMPKLQDEYNAMNSAERATWNQTLEYASKTTGYNEDPITEFDITSYAGLPHYAEAVMLRFDTNHDGALDKKETLDGVFPIFKRELGEISKIKIDFVNKAVLMYLMQYGEEPSLGNLLTWAITFDFLKDFHARRIRVYQIFAALSKPSAPDQISQTPPPGAGGVPYLSTIADGLVRGLTPPTTPPATRAMSGRPSTFDVSKVNPVQFLGYSSGGPVIDPNSPFQEALEVLPQDL